ncbi:SDR family NAD(P)-dependent oxidoreductase [Agrococcus sp. HG114]|uniref:SDR family NAD(P)-dependent oxidoreductase n=1 Tax=Agrococcus sp. HG114 TaxID=2969757 RepID=UPI00215B4427|nr:SDR family oxidoreductase [Agrococcus sp. HG114]MCR8669533.1 SDR family oxidoreductase [Agrococcus sp. HG114]
MGGSKERVLVTGGASGIGAAIVEQQRGLGRDVIVIDKQPGGIQADLSDGAQVAAALEEALADGPIHRLVNNVGYIRVAELEQLEIEDALRTYEINVIAAMRCSQALLPGMREARFGRIVNIASRAALGKAGRSAYSGSKAGIIGVTRTWALELGKHGITVNAVSPGPIRTAMFEAANPADDPRTRAIIDAIPVKRVGEPSDIAAAVGFLLDEAGFITGQNLNVCGGMTVGAAPL